MILFYVEAGILVVLPGIRARRTSYKLNYAIIYMSLLIISSPGRVFLVAQSSSTRRVVGTHYCHLLDSYSYFSATMTCNGKEYI